MVLIRLLITKNMMCKCCNGDKPNCGCMHHRMENGMHGGMGWVIAVVAVSVLWLLTNYEMISVDAWKWLAPVLFLLAGLAVAMKCKYHKGMKCKGGACGGECKKNGEESNGGKKCVCAGTGGKCQCPPKTEESPSENVE